MKILYLSGSYVPSRRASSVHVMRMCQAMAYLGHDVTLVTKENATTIEPGIRDDYAYYGVKPTFAIHKLSRPNKRGGGLSFTWKMHRLLSDFDVANTLVYSREIFGAWIAASKGFRIVFEAHTQPTSFFSKQLHKNIFQAGSFCRLVVISQALRDSFLASNLFRSAEEIVVAHDAADPSLIDIDERDRFVWKNKQLQLGYVGQLYSGKGIEVILPLARRMPDICFHVVGGHEKDLQYWKEQNPPPNLKFYGFVSHGEVAGLFKKFDILLLPPQTEVYGASGQSEIGRWMSPLKMFEYMATGKPIISSNLPVLQEILRHEENALLVIPDDIDRWQRAVERLHNDPGLARKISRKAYQDFIQNYTWTARVKKVLKDL